MEVPDGTDDAGAPAMERAPAMEGAPAMIPAGQSMAYLATVTALDAAGAIAPAPAQEEAAVAPAAAPAAAEPSGGAMAELRAHWPVLVVSCLAYVLLQAGNAFVPAITMVSSSEDLGMSIASFGALNSVGAGIKSVLIIFFMGPALERFGPHTLINWCLVGTALCNVLLAFCPNALSFVSVYLVNYVFNSLSEQPAYICLYATYFHELLGVTTTAIASAFSFAGFLIPPLLSPIMVAFGWRALWLVLAGAIVLLLPLAFLRIRPGPTQLNQQQAADDHRENLVVDMMVTVFASRVHQRALKHKATRDKSGFSGGRLSMISVTDPELVLHQLDKHHAIMGHEHSGSDPDVAFSDALRMPKFWALVVAAFSFFLYGGALNLHLPSILASEGGLSVTAASSVFSTYNIFAVGGKVLTGVFLQTPALKRSVPIYLPFQLCYLLSHLVLLEVDLGRVLSGGGLLSALVVTSDQARLTLYSACVGLSYGFCASLMQCLVKEYFGLRDLAKIQPIVYGCVIVGCMGGMFIPGFLHDLTGSYKPFLALSMCTTTINFACFVFLFFAHPIGEARPYTQMAA